MKKEGGKGKKTKKRKRSEEEEKKKKAEPSFYVPETRMESKEVEEGISSLARRKKRLGE